MSNLFLRRSLRGALALLGLGCALWPAGASGAEPGAADVARVDASSSLASVRTPTLLDRAPKLTTFKLGDEGDLSLLRAYLDAEVERPGPYNRYVGGPFGRWSKEPWQQLAWGQGERADAGESVVATRTVPEESAAGVELDRAERAEPIAFGFEAPPAERLRVRIRPEEWVTRLFVTNEEAPFWTTGPSLASNGFDTLWAAARKPVIDWRCRRRPVLFIRHGSENDRFSLVRCDGAVEVGAVDRLSILARPPDVPAPGELPDEPDPEAWEKGLEWLPRVKLVNPRLLWLLQKIADAFPYRAIYIYSGYRPHKDKSVMQGHHSMHGDGRAMDIQVHGVRNEQLFQFCRKLEDVGCGYYPNSKFVHVDVRKPGTGHAFWIDTSGPGEPSHYVDSWPGVVEKGALAWMRVSRDDAPPQGPRPRHPDERGTADVIRK
jgi:hypothetical protein